MSILGPYKEFFVQNRQAKIDVVPSAASLIIKELKEPLRDRKKVKHGTYWYSIHLIVALSYPRVIVVSRTVTCAAKVRRVGYRLQGTIPLPEPPQCSGS